MRIMADMENNGSMLEANFSGDDNWVTVSMATAYLSNATSVVPAPLPYLQPAYRFIGFFIVALIFVVGLLGNVLVVWVVTLTRAMHTPTNCYLVSLAIADILLLVSGPSATLVEFILGMHGQILFGSLACPAMVFTQYLGVNVSSLFITAFTVERYIAICHPMRSQTICTVSHAKRVICALWTFGILYCLPWFYLARSTTVVKPNNSTVDFCGHRLVRDEYTIYYTIDLIIFYVIPLLLSCVLYGLIAMVLFTDRPHHNNECGAPVTPVTPVTCRTPVIGQKGGTQLTNGSRPVKSSGTASRYQRYQVIKMLAVVVGMFAVLWLPYRGLVVYNSLVAAHRRYTDLWFILFCRVMIYINSAINPILYNAMSVKFRNAFRHQLTCGQLADERSSYIPVPGTGVTNLPAASSAMHRLSQITLAGAVSHGRLSQVSLTHLTGDKWSSTAALRTSQLSLAPPDFTTITSARQRLDTGDCSSMNSGARQRLDTGDCSSVNSGARHSLKP